MDGTPSQTLDRWLHAREAAWTQGLSPSSAVAAWADWALHLANAPGRRMELMRAAATEAAEFCAHQAAHAGQAEPPAYIHPQPGDRRFDDPGWQRWPFSAIAESFLLAERALAATTRDVEGASGHHLQMVGFTARQMLDMWSPSNFALTNPEVLAEWRRTGGMNFLRGARNAMEDWRRQLQHQPPVGAEDFPVGERVAVTPGKVVLRNRLMELIQYAPTTDKVRAEPILITPAWIMKYYILDLSPENSLVKFLRDRGHTVFMISWHNPGPEDRNLGMTDYLDQGPLAALQAIRRITGQARVHGVGYCLGGTLMTLAAALLGRDGQDQLASLTLLAAQTDFTEAGEIMLFIDPAQVAFLEDLMWERGYLDGAQMAGAFQMLRSNDLIWSRVVHDYLMGERRPMNDLMAWNADATRMPYRMHSEYLRRLFLENALAEGHYALNGGPVTLSDIQVPIFAVGAERDHVAPWRSVYKIGLLAATAEVTFLLTSGGHNAGIISEPGHPHRSFRLSSAAPRQAWLGPDEWFARTPVQEGSWWVAWADWLAARSGAEVEPPPMGVPGTDLEPVCDAPGRYVFET